MLNRFLSLNLASLSSGQDQRMDRAGENTGLTDLKENLRRLYEMVAIGIMDNKETTKEIKNLVDVVGYTSYHISNHDAKIDDNEMNLKEIMGKVDCIQEDLQRLVQMNQESQAHEILPRAAQRMEEESVTQPLGHPDNP